MADPQTTNVGLYQPTRGSDVGIWDLPNNANVGVVDSLASNIAAISLTNAPVTFTVPPNSGAAWSGPYQSQSGIIQFIGTLTGNVTVTIPRPGFFIIENLCTVGNYYVALASAAPGNVVGAPPGEATHIYCDGIDVKYVDFGRVGSALDLHGATALPAWMTACTKLPYLVKDGSIYLNTLYPALAAFLGTTFGGVGGLSFAVPDELARSRVAYDTTGTGRLTTAVSGVNGQTMGSAGGNQSMQQHNHAVTDPGHAHTVMAATSGNSAPVGGIIGVPALLTTSSSATGISIQNAGSGASQNVQPTIVSFLPLIKT